MRRGPDTDAGPARAPGARPRASSATSSSRGRSSSSAPAGGCRATGATPIRRGRDRGSAPRRLVAGRARRPGLVRARAGPRPRAARAGDRRPVVVHPGRLQRARSTPMRSSGGATSSRPARRALGELCDHRGRRGIRRPRRSARPRSSTPRPASTSSTARSGSSPGPDDTDFMIFHCLRRRRRAAPADPVPRRLRHARASTLKHDPDYTHTFADRHPQFVLEDVRVPASRGPRRGRPCRRADERVVRRGADPHRRAVHRRDGAVARRSAVEWATERIQFGERIFDFQGVSFPLADSAADASAARLLTRECAWLADTGADPKVVHAKASLAKLFASEAAWRCADRVVQVFGGRGYMREFAPERYLRELRVDRIWEGTSEIQRIDRSPERSRSAASAGSSADACGVRRGRAAESAGDRRGDQNRGHRPAPAVRAAIAWLSSARRRGRGSPRRSETTFGSWAARPAATSSTRTTRSSTASPATRAWATCRSDPTSCSWRSIRCVPRRSPRRLPRPASPRSSSRAAASWRAAQRRRRCRTTSRGSPESTASRLSAPTAWASST